MDESISNCDFEEIIRRNARICAPITRLRLAPSSGSSRRCSGVVMSWCHECGESQPLTESSAAAIGHSKQRRGWQRTVSRWISPCAPRAPILPRGAAAGNLAHRAPRDRVGARSGQALPLAGRGIGEVEIAGVRGQCQRERNDAAGQDVDRPVGADSRSGPRVPVNARSAFDRSRCARARSPEWSPVVRLARWPRRGGRPRPGASVPDGWPAARGPDSMRSVRVHRRARGRRARASGSRARPHRGSRVHPGALRRVRGEETRPRREGRRARLPPGSRLA